MVEATKENFDELVAEGVTLVDVWGPQCAPCVAMMPAPRTFVKRELPVLSL